MAAKPHSSMQQVSTRRKRTRKVRPYPIHALEDALAVAKTIQDSNAGLPFDRILLAKAMGTTPASSGYTMKLNSSSRYGLTQGGYSDQRISLSPRGEAIVAPKGGEELQMALMEAATHPDLFSQFYEKLDGKRLPEDAYVQNMLLREYNISPDLTGECLGIIKSTGLYVGILTEVGDSLYVRLGGPGDLGEGSAGGLSSMASTPANAESEGIPMDSQKPRIGRIFIGHSGDSGAVRFVRVVLDQLGIPYGIVEVDDHGTIPVPAPISDEMRSCAAAILVFADDGSNEHGAGPRARDKMMYQLGAASVLFGNRIVVLREAGFQEPSSSPDLSIVEFDRDMPGESGLSLLRELQRVGAVKVTV